MQTPSIDECDDRLWLQGDPDDDIAVLRTAALRILKLFGRDGEVNATDEAYAAFRRRAHKDGFKVSYLRAFPGTIGKAPGKWDTPPGTDGDPFQHVLDIDIDGRVFGIGWRGNGPIAHDRFERGPWEFEILRSAGMLTGPEGMLAFPHLKSRWRGPSQLKMPLYIYKLKAPLTFSVVSYTKFAVDYADPGVGFLDLQAQIEKLYEVARAADGELHAGSGSTTSFGLRAWSGRRALFGGKQRGTPDFRYWIAPNSVSLAAELLLIFDREIDVLRKRSISLQPEDWPRYFSSRAGAMRGLAARHEPYLAGAA